MRLSELDYDLPEDLIAQEPIANRADARILVLNRRTGEIEHSRFYKLARHLRDGDLLVLNDTRVFPARLTTRKDIRRRGRVAPGAARRNAGRRHGSRWRGRIGHCARACA